MTLKDEMAADLDSVFFDTGDFSESVTYTSKGGAGVPIMAIVIKDSPFQEPYVRGEETARCEIEVKASDVANPQYGDTFTIDGVTWEFDPTRGVISDDGYTLIIGLERELT
ncbi:MAG: hypothetical protein JXB42_01740 [Deltaproteobacteria bacterium]|nr:hypothetical protein [Deltaproteobacteria bacterium]